MLKKNIKPRPGTTRTKVSGENKHEQSCITCGVVQFYPEKQKNGIFKKVRLFLAGEAGKAVKTFRQTSTSVLKRRPKTGGEV